MEVWGPYHDLKMKSLNSVKSPQKLFKSTDETGIVIDDICQTVGRQIETTCFCSFHKFNRCNQFLFSGNDLQYHKEVQHKNSAGVLATLKSDHQWYLNKIPASVKEALTPVLPANK